MTPFYKLHETVDYLRDLGFVVVYTDKGIYICPRIF